MTRAEIRSKALKMPRRDRARLAHELLLSLDAKDAEDPAEVEAAWADEITRRVDEVREKKVDLVDHRTVMASARAAVAAVRRKASPRRQPR